MNIFEKSTAKYFSRAFKMALPILSCRRSEHVSVFADLHKVVEEKRSVDRYGYL